MTKEFNKQAKRLLARVSFYYFTWLFSVLPYRVICVLSNTLLALTFLILKRMRKHAIETLRIAFGKVKTEDELKAILKNCFYNLGRGFIELAYLISHPNFSYEKITFQGNSRHNLDAAFKEGKGVIAFTGHFGNFSFMFAYLAQLGYPTSAILRPSRDPKMEKPLFAIRSRFGLKSIYTIPRTTCVAQTIRALRKNEMVIIPMDQNNGSKAAVFVEFFGRQAGTASGPAIFAMRTGSCILPIFTRRTGYDTHEIIIEPHFYLEQKSTDEETIQYNIQKITSIIERYVRLHPEEWSWMHRRWKSQRQPVVAPSANANPAGEML